MKRLDQLTFMRFAAVLLVLFYHGTAGFYISFAAGSPALMAVLFTAPTAVSFLYVLSGFVMSLVYHKPGEAFDVFTYWRARFIRIYPLYIISFLLTCYYYIPGVFDIKPQKILANVFVLQAWFPAYSQSFNYASWSMTVEFFFYAVFPFFTLWAYRQSTRKLIWTAVLFWAVSQLTHYALWQVHYPENRGFIVYFPVFHLNSFIMGAVGGIWYLRMGQRADSKPFVIALALAVSFLFYAGYSIVSTVYYPSLPHDLQPMAGLLAPVMTLFIAALAVDRSRISKILNHRALVSLGETSYAIYILHVPIAWLYERALENSSLADPRRVFEITFLPLMVAVGLLSYFYIDPALRRWLKNTLQRVSMGMLILDLVLVAVSVYVSFRFRFGEGREFNRFWSTAQIMFWSAFLLRTVFSVWFNSLNPAVMRGTFLQMAKPVLASVTAASLAVAGVLYLVYRLGVIENFPRSIFLMDWVLMLGLSLLVRYLFRAAFSRQPKLQPV